MFKLKRSMALFLVLLFVSVMIFAGCGKQAETTEGTTTAGSQAESSATGTEATLSLPIVKDKVTVKFMRFKHPLNIPLNDMPMFKNLEEATNVHIEWDDVAHTAWAERLSLALASGDIPDAIFGGGLTDNDVLNNKQLFLPLEDKIDQLAPNIAGMFAERPDAKAQSTADDGHIYSIPMIYEIFASATTPSVGINKAWLDNLGLAAPTTTDEFYNVLKAFKENDPNKNNKKDEIPFIFATLTNDWAGVSSLWGSFGVLPSFRIPTGNTTPMETLQVVNGQLVYPHTQPGFKEGIQYFHKLYSEGLIDQEVFTQDATQYLAKIAQDPPIAGVFAAWTFKDMANQNRKDEYVQLLPLKGPNGDQLYHRTTPQTIIRHAFLISAKTEYPDVIVRWINECYTEDMAMQMLNGSYGVTIEKQADGTIKFNTPPEGKDLSSWTWENATVSYSPTAMYKEWEPKIPATQGSIDKAEINANYEPYLPEKVYPNIFYPKAVLDEVTPLRNDIDAFIYEKVTQWIVKGGVENEWDAYLDRLNKMGLPRMIEIYTEAYNNYYNQ